MDTDNSHPPLHVFVVGLNHTCSRVDLRDRLLFTGPRLFEGLGAIKSAPGIVESLILSTCNRVELYAVAPDPEQARGELLDFLSRFHGIGRSEIEPHTYYYRCDDAARHLFEVTASLDSVVVGEYQILGQVKEAHKAALESGNTGPALNTLFKLAITAGKRARAETKIGDGALSIASAAVKLARQILGDLARHTALILGAGEMSELTVKHLKQAGIGRLVFANRTLERSMALAREFDGRAVEFAAVESTLPECDVIISATASPHYILGVQAVEAAMAKRKNSPMFLIDIAAPRDIHPDVNGIYNVFLYNIDDLIKVTQDTTQAREQEIGKVRAIMAEETGHYNEWYASFRIRPLLLSLRAQFETIRDNELRRYASDLNALSPEARDFVRTFAISLTNKFLREPSKSLIEMSGLHEPDQLTETVQRLFGLKEKP